MTLLAGVSRWSLWGSAALVLAALGSGAAARAQRVYTAQDYAEAERWMGYNTAPLVQHTPAGFTYLADGRVFFHDSGPGGVAYKIADPKSGVVAPAFDQAKLAAALRTASGRAYDASRLGVTSYAAEAGGGFTIEARGAKFRCDAAGTKCDAVTPAEEHPVQTPVQKPSGQPPAGMSATETGGNAQMAAEPAGSRTGAQNAAAGTVARGTRAAASVRAARPVGRTKAPFDLSPDGRFEAFIRDWNLWIRDTATGEERQLTTDGVKDFGYATDNAGWQHSDAPILVWSPDGKKIATFQQDQRKDGEMYLVPVTNRHPELEAWKYPLLGDQDVTMIEPVVIDVAAGAVTRLKMPPQFHRSTLCDDVSCRGGAGWDDVQFSADGTQLAIVTSSRDHKDAWLKVANTATGAVRDVYHEHQKTYYESGVGKVNWRFLPETNEFLWFSQSTDWGQMYLGDLTTGKIKNAVTHGTGTVTQVLAVNAKERAIYFLATGKEAGRDPYYSHFYRASFDGSAQQLLTPEDADHAVTPAPDGSSFVDVSSTTSTPAAAVLRDNRGKELARLGQQDIASLKAAGWAPPTPITVKARDGKTTLYGFLWKPMKFDAAKKYPVVDYVYPGPFTGSCHSRSFHASELDHQALANLGFVVVCIDGMGTPWRSKTFQDAYADTPAGLAEDTIPDQVSGIRDLASRYAWIDLDRVGIWGHSGGGNATASAMFHYPDFFKVGWSESGNHDNREYEDDWDEKYGGLEKVNADGSSNYDVQANQNFAGNLKGHLMLVHGTMDDNVPMNNTLLVVDALMKANKDFDLLLVPNAHHGYASMGQYVMRRRWDYFVKNLAGGVPPKEFAVKSYADAMRAQYGEGPGDGAEKQAESDPELQESPRGVF